MQVWLAMDLPRATESTGRAGDAPKAPGRRSARSHPCFATVVSLVCAAAILGTASFSAVPAGAAMARADPPFTAMARAHAAAVARAHAAAVARAHAAAKARAHGAAKARAHAAAKARAHAAAKARAHAAAKAGTAVASSRNVTSLSSRDRSGLPWLSGAYVPADTSAAAAAFGDWRKRPLDIAEVWLNQSTWASLTDPAWLYRNWRGKPETLVVSAAMLPNVAGVSIRACAQGAYNAHWRRFGQVISSYGLGSSIIRLGWEFNGKWYRWSATNPTQWAQCWRQVVTSARSTAPRLRWDWNVNRGLSSALADPTQAYPGNSYVSIVGVDSYDWWPSARSSGGWHQQLDGPQGLNYWLAFAKAHGKQLSVPEWGSIRYGRSSGGDDPRYVKDMRAFFAANAQNLAYEAIFQGPVGSYANGHLMPAAAQAYKASF
jgi:hypothetical protein